MKPISSSEELKQRIAELEKKVKLDEITIKGQLGRTREAVKPQNFVRNSFASFAEMPEVKRTLISTVIGFGLGYLSKKATEAMNEDKLNRMVSALVDHGMNTLMERNPDSLITKGLHLTRQVAKERGIHFF